jgi:hypothetical protein
MEKPRMRTAAVVAVVVIATAVAGWYAVSALGEDDPARDSSFDAHRAGFEYGRVMSKLYDGDQQSPDLTSAQLLVRCERAASTFGTKRQEAHVERMTKQEIDLQPLTDAQRLEFVDGCSESV